MRSPECKACCNSMDFGEQLVLCEWWRFGSPKEICTYKIPDGQTHRLARQQVIAKGVVCLTWSSLKRCLIGDLPDVCAYLALVTAFVVCRIA